MADSKTKEERLTADVARQWIDFNPVTGCMKWKRSPRADILPFMEVGSIGPRGYVNVTLLGMKFSGHRLAWLLHYGEWPTHVVDHINGRPADNRICNLRDVTQRVNCQNQRRAQRHSSTGLIGVSPLEGKFAAHITVDGRKRYLGSFEDPQQAHSAYVEAKRELHEGNSI